MFDIPDYKLQSAQKALQFVRAGQTVGLGNGTTMLHLADLIAADQNLAASITFTSSSAKTSHRLKAFGLSVIPPSDLQSIDIYFDGCDQFDHELNALKSGGGIHTLEKILATMSTQFILVGDADKFSEQLTSQYPVVVEILPQALKSVIAKLQFAFPDASYKLRQKNGKDNAMTTDNGNYLLDITFNQLPELAPLDKFIKMLPGVVDHSLFYRLATKAIVSGPDGVKIIYPVYTN